MTEPIPPIEGETIDPDVPVVAGWSDAPVDGDRIDLSVSSIVAGTPGAARVELGEDGLHAYDASGVETARIVGEEGVFVGGEFRTSDALPGQVTLSDTGYTHSGTGVSRPGIRIDPEDSTGLAAPAGIGPVDAGFEIDGGRSTSGERTSITMRPGYSLIRADGALAGTGVGDISVQPAGAQIVARNGVHDGSIRAEPGGVFLGATHPNGEAAARAAADTLSARINAYRTDGSAAGAVEATHTAATVSVRDAAGATRGSMEVSETGATSRSFSGNASESGWVRARPQDAELAYVAPDNTYASRILADASEAFLYTSAGGTQRYLTVDATGIWVKAGAKSYNLEETAQDSDWVTFTPVSGITANNTSWRNKGGVMWFRGFVTATWVSGWNLVRGGFVAGEIPTFGVERPAWNAAGVNYGVRMRATGDLEVYAPTAGSATIRLDGLNYPTT